MILENSMEEVEVGSYFKSEINGIIRIEDVDENGCARITSLYQGILNDSNIIFTQLKLICEYADEEDIKKFLKAKQNDQTDINRKAKKMIQEEIKNKSFRMLKEVLEEYNLADIRIKIPDIELACTIPSVIAIEQANLAIVDFLEEEKNLNESNLQEMAEEYVAKNFSDDFLKSLIKRKMKIEDIKNQLVDEVISMFINRRPYNQQTLSYWQSKVTLASIEELSKLVNSEDLGIFIERYAPDWESEAWK